MASVREPLFKPALALLLIASLLDAGCRRAGQPAHEGVRGPAAGEPQNYSATVIRTVERDGASEITITRIARLAEMERQEWTDNSETLVCIWRPDLGKVFLLSLERRIYVESHLGGSLDSGGSTPAQTEPKSTIETSEARPASLDPGLNPDSIDRVFEPDALPEQIESNDLPDEVVDGWVCRVSHVKATFAGGRFETTKAFLARDLNGLPVRVENETWDQSSRVRVVTERRNIRTDVAPDEFLVPNGFRKVDSLTRL
ncbi:MAG TPA: hypothetical protein VG778_09540 [Blastocatellia bacterium]|nr:hypothetical protein [Blastocatellia bacterium]